MSVSFTINVGSLSEMHEQLAALLKGFTPSQVSTAAGTSPPREALSATSEPTDEGRDNAPAPAMLPLVGSEVPKRRGRPTKNPPAEAPVDEKPGPAAAGSLAQAVDAASEASAAAPSPALTFDEVKAKLQQVAARDNGAGLRDATAIIHEFGYDMIKKIKPEHFAAIAAKCDEILTK